MSDMYLASSNIPADEASYTFPQTLGPLRYALEKAQNVLECPKCNSDTGPRRQNTNFIIIILSSLACGFDKLLRDVSTEATRLSASGERVSFRMGSLSPQTAHLHTGGDDCPMNFKVDLEAEEWRRIAFRTIKSHIDRTSDDKLTLEGLVDRLEVRQRTWHSSMESGAAQARTTGRELTCIQLAHNVRIIIQDMPT